jgi:hypothetical protein
LWLKVSLFICLETGGIFIAPRPSADNSMPKPEFATRPFFGVEPVLLDNEVCPFSRIPHASNNQSIK